MMKLACPLLLSTLFLLAGCFNAPLPSGTVLDANTGEPIEGAYVLARFVGDGPYVFPDPGATARNRCYGALLTETTSSGSYDFLDQQGARPETDDYKHHQRILLTAYKAGYTTVADPKQAVPSSRIPLYSRPDYIAAAGDNSHLRLRKVESVGEAERISYVANLLNDTCYPPPENINALANAVFRELSALPNNLNLAYAIVELCRNLGRPYSLRPKDSVQIDCGPYQEKLDTTYRNYSRRLAEIVEGIQVDGLSNLTYVHNPNVNPMANANRFIIQSASKDINAKLVFTFLQKVCESDFPRNLAEGTVCVLFRPQPDDWEQRTDLSCDAHYHLYSDSLILQSGTHRGEVLKIGREWCR